MGTILSTIAISDGKVKRASLEVLSRCRHLAEQHGHDLHAAILDPEASSYVDTVKQFGPSKIYLVEDPIFENHINTPVLRAMAKVMDEAHPVLTAFASTESTKDFLGALGAQQGAAVLPDVAAFEMADDGISAQRPVMAAKVLANTKATGDSILVSVRAGAYDMEESPSDPEIVNVDFSFDEEQLKAKLREVITTSSDEVDLSEAETIVAAGRGVKDDEGQNLISELASLLNAGIGASRALTEAGMYDPSKQIGQTGKVVSPQLYIAVGISGAIQHVAGMSNSKVIVAINKDPDAPIFDIADYGVVGDLYEVLPAFIDEVKKIKE